jgi:hypothetical protein
MNDAARLPIPNFVGRASRGGCYMPDLRRLGIGSITFLIGAVIYGVGLVMAFGKRGKSCL